MRFRSCKCVPLTHAKVELNGLKKRFTNRSARSIGGDGCATVLSNEMHFLVREIVSSGRFSY